MRCNLTQRRVSATFGTICKTFKRIKGWATVRSRNEHIQNKSKISNVHYTYIGCTTKCAIGTVQLIKKCLTTLLAFSTFESIKEALFAHDLIIRVDTLKIQDNFPHIGEALMLDFPTDISGIFLSACRHNFYFIFLRVHSSLSTNEHAFVRLDNCFSCGDSDYSILRLLSL